MYACVCTHLEIDLRVPVRVEEDDGVGRLQVEAEAAGARREHEDEVGRVGGIEALEELAAVLGLGAAVEAEVLEAAVDKVVLHDGHQLRHLGEDEHAVASGAELRQDAVEEGELARGADEVLLGEGGAGLVLEEVRVVADLAQLHQRVHETLHAGLCAV